MCFAAMEVRLSLKLPNISASSLGEFVRNSILDIQDFGVCFLASQKGHRLQAEMQATAAREGNR